MTDSATFNGVLIANRGEIAVRIIRTARKLGYETIAVYSEADAQALHTKLADRAVLIGGSAPRDSYLSIERILEACRATSAQALHPGYGFLSENAELPRACQRNGIIFIGPSSDAVASMGNKSKAKALMQEAGVPCLKGYGGPHQELGSLAEQGRELGFPLMIKAAAGGGGRGLRLVSSAPELLASLQSAREEAQASFGSGELLLEQALIGARHIEIQIFGDKFGNIIHLGERDCSVQRRHQKVFEESPSPAVSPSLRQQMGVAAVRAARAIQYVGAGTVEFLLDREGNYYFLEMNTRLQVEHAVTEMITGFDLVEWQLLVAAGNPLPVRQDEVRFHGHAIEARLYAEDPRQQFRPQVGPVLLFEEPGTDLARTDHGLNRSDQVSPYYDCMLAKVISHATDRRTALRRLERALEETVVLGIKSNREFLLHCLAQSSLIQGKADTNFIAETWKPEALANPESEPNPNSELKPESNQNGDLKPESKQNWDLKLESKQKLTQNLSSSTGTDVDTVMITVATLLGVQAEQHGELAGWCSSGHMRSLMKLLVDGHTEYEVEAQAIAQRTWRIKLDNQEKVVEIVGAETGDQSKMRFVVNGALKKCRMVMREQQIHISTARNTHTVSDITYAAPAQDAATCDGDILSPTFGLLSSLTVQVGDLVDKGSPLCTIESMKLIQTVIAPLSGAVRAVLVQTGQQVKAHQLIVQIEPVQEPVQESVQESVQELLDGTQFQEKCRER